MKEHDASLIDLAFNDRRDRCLNLLSREMEKERAPLGMREWFMALIHAFEQDVRPGAALSPHGWRYQQWHLRQARRLQGLTEARRQALQDVTDIALRAGADPACPAPVAKLIQHWIDEMHRRFDVASRHERDRVGKQS